jgi:hypothetical protein
VPTHNKIIDEFTHLDISRQRRYQLRAERDKRCRICGSSVLTGFKLCAVHHEEHLLRCRRTPVNLSPADLI